MRWFIGGLVAIVGAAVVIGLAVVGSPRDERERRFDGRRVEDLQFLQAEIVGYWQRKDELPASLEVLRDDIRGVVVPSDPETGAPYGYKVLGAEHFTICAPFIWPSEGGKSGLPPRPAMLPEAFGPYRGAPENWEHGVGLTCFERTIDRELYKKPLPER